MKRIETVFISVGFSILPTLSILLALGSKISNTVSPSAQSAPSGLRADGDPPPPFPRPTPILPSVIRTTESTEIADGDPPPPFPPLPKPRAVIYTNESMFVADGDPPPPFPRPPLGSQLGQAELRYLAARDGELSSV